MCAQARTSRTTLGTRLGRVDFRRATTAEFSRIAQILRDGCDADITSEWLHWAYGRATRPAARLYVATDTNDVIAVLGMQPVELHTGTRTTEADRLAHPTTTSADGSTLADLVTFAVHDRATRDPVIGYNGTDRGECPLPDRFRHIQRRAVYARLNKPSALLGTRLGRLLDPIVPPALEFIAKGRRMARTFELTLDPTPIDVVRTTGIPAGTLSDLFTRHTPNRVHPHRSRDYYRHRDGNPCAEQHTYLAYCHGDVAAAIVVETRTQSGLRISYLTDVAPPAGRLDRHSLLDALFGVAVGEHEDSDVIMASEDLCSHARLSAWGFIRCARTGLAGPVRPFDLYITEDHGDLGGGIGRSTNWYLTAPVWP